MTLSIGLGKDAIGEFAKSLRQKFDINALDIGALADFPTAG